MDYTKGKWEQHGNSIQVSERGCICLAPKPTEGGVLERMDNLSLIATAPRMYEALKLIASCESVVLGDVVDIAHKALAKVESKGE